MPLIALLLLASCVPRSQVRALEAENDALQLQLALSQASLAQTAEQLNECSQELATAQAGPARPSAAEEEAAMLLYNELNEAISEGRMDEARELADRLLAEHGGTRIASRATRIQQELSVIGLGAPPLEVEQWFQGERYDWGRVTVVVFFEVWCPHCKREVPQLEARYQELSPRGLEVMALTRLTRSSTWEGTQAFIDEKGLSYPIAQETGSVADYFKVTGIPAAAVVQDGQIVWRGHPARIDWDWIAGLL